MVSVVSRDQFFVVVLSYFSPLTIKRGRDQIVARFACPSATVHFLFYMYGRLRLDCIMVDCMYGRLRGLDQRR